MWEVRAPRAAELWRHQRADWAHAARLARSAARRCTSVTEDDVRASSSASSAAESPPPTTSTGLPRKRKPSHVAQLETPPPRYSASPATPSQRELAPVATMSARTCSGAVLPLRRTVKGSPRPCDPRLPRPTSAATSESMSAPKTAACRRIRRTRPGPVAWDTPGKFSTSTPLPCSCPPKLGATTTGRSPALAA